MSHTSILPHINSTQNHAAQIRFHHCYPDTPTPPLSLSTHALPVGVRNRLSGVAEGWTSAKCPSFVLGEMTATLLFHAKEYLNKSTVSAVKR
jgi:hypothetical protein